MPDPEVATILVAIAGAESGWNPNAYGDSTYNMKPEYNEQNKQWSCQVLVGSVYVGFYSWGLWQINIPAHHSYMQSIGAGTTPCQQAAWLRNPYNNALMAVHAYHEALQSSYHNGFMPWKNTWTSGAYKKYWDQAKAAVEAEYGTSITTSPGGFLSSASPILVAIAIIAAGYWYINYAGAGKHAVA